MDIKEIPFTSYWTVNPWIVGITVLSHYNRVFAQSLVDSIHFDFERINTVEDVRSFLSPLSEYASENDMNLVIAIFNSEKFKIKRLIKKVREERDIKKLREMMESLSFLGEPGYEIITSDEGEYAIFEEENDNEKRIESLGLVGCGIDEYIARILVESGRFDLTPLNQE